jgi:hypothetical protein
VAGDNIVPVLTNGSVNAEGGEELKRHACVAPAFELNVQFQAWRKSSESV